MILKKYKRVCVLCLNSLFRYTWFTIHIKGARSITFCSAGFSFPKRKDSLSAWRSGQKIIAEGTPLKAALSIPGTFMHELSHYVTHGGKSNPFCALEVCFHDKCLWIWLNVIAITEVPYADTSTGLKTTAYGPLFVSKLARSSADFAVQNADSYTWFATAMYLDQCDWSRTICAKSTSISTVTARSDNQTSSYISGLQSLKRRTLLPRLPMDFESELVWGSLRESPMQETKS